MVLNLLVKPFWLLGIDRSVQNAVGAEDYGFYFALFNFSFLFSILLDFGITNFNNRNIAQNQQLIKKHLSNIIVIKLLLFIVYLLFTFIGAFLIGYSRAQINMLTFLAFNQFVAGFILYLRSNLSGLHLFKTDSLLSVLDRTLIIIICSVLLWGNVLEEFKIEYFVYAQTASYILTAIITLFIVVKKSKSLVITLNWNLPFIIMIIKKSIPYALLVLLMTFYNRVDSVMLERLLNDGFVYSGIYASAYRLLDASNMVAYLFAVLLLPIFARMIKQQQDVRDLVKLSFSILFTGALILGITSVFYSKEIMQMLYHIHPDETIEAYNFRMIESSRVFAVLMMSFIAISSTYIFGTLLTAGGKLKLLNYVAMTGLFLNVVLNFIFIPYYKSTGAAYASLSTQLLVAIVQVFIVIKLFNFEKNYSYLVRLISFIASVVVVNLMLSFSEIAWYYNLIIVVFVCFIIAVLLNLVQLKKIFNLLFVNFEP
ncbi:MAG: oligosaccharide flippase family protein [Bacteroidales bacterium]